MHRLVSIQEVVKGFRSRPIRRNESNGGNVTIERRTRQRFPLNLELRFTASMSRRSPVKGRGEVVNLSSRGVAFRTETPLTPGLSIEASMEWQSLVWQPLLDAVFAGASALLAIFFGAA